MELLEQWLGSGGGASRQCRLVGASAQIFEGRDTARRAPVGRWETMNGVAKNFLVGIRLWLWARKLSGR